MTVWLEILNFGVEVWSDTRPILRRIVGDFVVAVSFWLVLFLFHTLESRFPVDGWASKFVAAVHEAGIVVSIAIFVLLSVTDLWLHFRDRMKGHRP